MPMIRTQVYLPQDLHLQLSCFAQKNNTTISKAIRKGANMLLKKTKKKKKLLPFENMIGKGAKGGPKDLATNLDYYLYEEPYEDNS